MLKIYSLVFWVPTIVAIVLFAACWSMELLTIRTGALFGSWFLLALASQSLARSPAMWAVGLVMQVALAVTLSLRLKLT